MYSVESGEAFQTSKLGKQYKCPYKSVLETQSIKSTFIGRMSLVTMTSFLFSNNMDKMDKMRACSIHFGWKKNKYF